MSAEGGKPREVKVSSHLSTTSSVPHLLATLVI
jgi:hypothetical protein